MCVTWRMTTPRKLLWIVSLPTVIRGGVFGSELRAAIRNCATAESTHNLSGPSSCPAPELVPAAAYPPATVANLALPTLRAVQSNKLLCSPWRPQSNAPERGDAAPRFRVTHPFHPLFGQLLEVAA